MGKHVWGSNRVTEGCNSTVHLSEFFQSYNCKRYTSLVAPGTLAHYLQLCTTCTTASLAKSKMAYGEFKIADWVWKFLGATVNFCKINFWFNKSFYEKFKIQNGCKGAPKWPMGSEILGAPANFCFISFFYLSNPSSMREVDDGEKIYCSGGLYAVLER